MPFVNYDTLIQSDNNKITGSASRLAGNLAVLAALPPGAFPRALTETNYFTQISVMETICIPAQKPDIQQVENIDITVQIYRQSVVVTPTSPLDTTTTLPTPNLEGNVLTGRKLLLSGALCLTITYTADDNSSGVHSAEFSLPFAAFIVVPQTFAITTAITVDALDVHFIVNSLVEDTYANILTPRTLFTNTTLFLQAAPIIDNCPTDNDLNNTLPITINGICPPEKLAAMLNPTICGTNITRWTQSILAETIFLPPQYPALADLMSISGRIAVLSQRVITTPTDTTITTNQEGSHLTGKKLIIEALLKIKIIYAAANCNQSTHTAFFDIPFSSFIIIDSTDSLNTKFFIDACLENISTKKIDERTLQLQTALFIKAYPNQIIDYRSILDALPRYQPQFCCFSQNISIEGICNPEKIKLLAATNGLGMWKQLSVANTTSLPPCKPAIENLRKIYIAAKILSQKVIDTPSGTNLYNMTITGKKLVVEVLLLQKIVYTAATPSQPIHSFQTRQAFSAFIVLPPEAADDYCVESCIEDVFAIPLDCNNIFSNVTIFLQAKPRTTVLCRTTDEKTPPTPSAFAAFTLEDEYTIV